MGVLEPDELNWTGLWWVGGDGDRSELWCRPPAFLFSVEFVGLSELTKCCVLFQAKEI